MTRRPPGVTQLTLPALIALLFFLPAFAVSQQQEQPHNGHSAYEASLSDRSSSLAPTRREDKPLETSSYKHFKDTEVNTNSPSAIATLAPAGLEHAVRAPPARFTGKSAGLSSLLNARSLQDWEVEDFVLLATVDGTIHARDRKTGTARWALEVDRPMVETTYHRQNRSKGGDPRPEEEFLWIVEPSRDGNLYVYNPGPKPAMQKLGLTVKRLVEELSPYAGEDPAVVYTAEKKNTLYTVDAGSGRILKMFSSRGSSINDEQSCRRVSGLEALDDEECGSSGTLTLGRTEYTVGIQSRDSGDQICTLTYSEWGPNNRDSDLQSQYFSTMDHKYVYSRHDGSIFGFDHAQTDDRRKLYTQKFPSPVARVFDVARPMDVDTRDTPLVILPQPIAPQDREDLYNGLNDRSDRVFVNLTDAGGWYAMSEVTYPLVTGGAPTAQCYDRDWIDITPTWDTIGLIQRQKALVGVHAISKYDTYQDRFATISGPEFKAADQNPPNILSDAPQLTSVPAIGGSRLIGTATENAKDILILIMCAFAGMFFFLNRRYAGHLLRKNLDLKYIFPALEQPLTSTPSTPIVTKMEFPMEVHEDRVAIEGLPLETPEQILVSRSRSSTLAEHIDIGARDVEVELNGDADFLERTDSNPIDVEGTPRVRIEEPSVNDDEGPASSPDAEKKKKKASRGRRGGKNHSKASKKGGGRKHEVKNSLDQAVDEAMNIGRDPSVEPDVIKVNGLFGSDIADVSGPIVQIGQLRVFTDTVLGFGSHGTIVYKGSFDGRDVAVKRMLLEFFDIASHEVGLLQESDDHANVIRYFNREQAGEFLYIALELCPASLQDVIEKPDKYPALIGLSGLDLPDVLKQITAGVRYLHSLKIVHRDLKPQNILVAAPKKLRAQPNAVLPPRLLISDFGLCKKLEGDQSSFRATTAHAAGTSGWRAPELLVDDDAGPQPPSLSDITHSGETSEPAVVDPQTNRRATRAIDMFSLGCVFYYVLTRGNHPFDKDGRYMREANIVKGLYNLDDLQRLGDYAYEADDLIRQMLAQNPRDR